MFSANIIIASAFSLLVREAENAPCSLCKTLHSCHSFLLIYYEIDSTKKEGELGVGKRLEFVYKKVTIFQG